MPRVSFNNLTQEQYELLTCMFDDAIYYRRSDDEGEDADNDNAQVDKYVEIMESMEVEE